MRHISAGTMTSKCHLLSHPCRVVINKSFCWPKSPNLGLQGYYNSIARAVEICLTAMYTYIIYLAFSVKSITNKPPRHGCPTVVFTTIRNRCDAARQAGPDPNLYHLSYSFCPPFLDRPSRTRRKYVTKSSISSRSSPVLSCVVCVSARERHH